MSTLDKNNKELIKELEVLRQEYHSLQASYDKDYIEHKKIENALRESEKQYRLLIDTANESILIAQDGILKFVNPKTLDLLEGYSEQELLNRPFYEFIYPDDREMVTENYQLRIANVAVQPQYAFRVVTKRGMVKWVEINAVLFEWQGKPATLNFLSDITERKQAEEEIKQKNQELVLLNASKDKFFSIIAHDLRSPFQTLLGFTQIMAEELPTLTLDKIQDIAVSMRSSANKLYNLLENLLEWSQMQRGLINLNPVSLQLSEEVKANIKIIRNTADKKNITICFNIPKNLNVLADEQMFASLIRNLVFNAVKFTPKGGKVTISARPMPGDTVEISISDTGIGMSKVILDSLFHLDTAPSRKGTEGEPSTGLGLLLCKDYVEKHGGRIWAESEEGKGSVFYLIIPGRA